MSDRDAFLLRLYLRECTLQLGNDFVDQNGRGLFGKEVCIYMRSLGSCLQWSINSTPVAITLLFPASCFLSAHRSQTMRLLHTILLSCTGAAGAVNVGHAAAVDSTCIEQGTNATAFAIIVCHAYMLFHAWLAELVSNGDIPFSPMSNWSNLFWLR